MHGLTAREVIQQTACYTIWRRGSVLAVRFVGAFGDAESDQWRSRCVAELEGHPEIVELFIDMSESDPRHGIAARMRSAAAARAAARRLRGMYLYTGGKAGPTVVASTVLRVVGLANVHMVRDEREFTQRIEQSLAHALSADDEVSRGA